MSWAEGGGVGGGKGMGAKIGMLNEKRYFFFKKSEPVDPYFCIYKFLQWNGKGNMKNLSSSFGYWNQFINWLVIGMANIFVSWSYLIHSKRDVELDVNLQQGKISSSINIGMMG